jgi:hypothetical protein
VKNYLRKVYDKLGVADRLELALFCLNNRVIDESKSKSVQPTNGAAEPAAATNAAAAAASGSDS